MNFVDFRCGEGEPENRQRQKKKQVSPLRIAKARRFGRDDNSRVVRAAVNAAISPLRPQSARTSVEMTKLRLDEVGFQAIEEGFQDLGLGGVVHELAVA